MVLTLWLESTAREVSNGRVNTVECRFCRSFGKDDTCSDPKRRRTESINVFSKPWRSDHMKVHVQEQHSVKYDEYAELSDEQMKTRLWNIMLPWNRVLTSPMPIFQTSCEHVLVVLTVCAWRAV
jgi:hypothetical protein